MSSFGLAATRPFFFSIFLGMGSAKSFPVLELWNPLHEDGLSVNSKITCQTYKKGDANLASTMMDQFPSFAETCEPCHTFPAFHLGFLGVPSSILGDKAVHSISTHISKQVPPARSESS